MTRIVQRLQDSSAMNITTYIHTYIQLPTDRAYSVVWCVMPSIVKNTCHIKKLTTSSNHHC